MEYINHPAEYSAPPPEHRPKPELEYTALPPEYGQKTYPEPETAEKGSLLRRLLVIPALLLTGFLCFHSTKAAAELPDVTEPLPVETTAPIPEETAAPIPELPEGSVILDVRYAVRDGDTVLYEYEVYTPTPSLDATQEQIDAYEGPIWPVSVYAQVTDASAQTAVLVYLLLGLFLPLFSGGNTGAAALAGPTGGYLWSYLLMVPVICLFCAIPVKRRRSAYALALLGCLPALGLCYLCGTLQFCFVTGTGFRRALSLCVAPFVGFDLLKALAASLLGVELRRRLARLWT